MADRLTPEQITALRFELSESDGLDKVAIFERHADALLHTADEAERLRGALECFPIREIGETENRYIERLIIWHHKERSPALNPEVSK